MASSPTAKIVSMVLITQLHQSVGAVSIVPLRASASAMQASSTTSRRLQETGVELPYCEIGSRGCAGQQPSCKCRAIQKCDQLSSECTLSTSSGQFTVAVYNMDQNTIESKSTCSDWDAPVSTRVVSEGTCTPLPSGYKIAGTSQLYLLTYAGDTSVYHPGIFEPLCKLPASDRRYKSCCSDEYEFEYNALDFRNEVTCRYYSTVCDSCRYYLDKQSVVEIRITANSSLFCGVVLKYGPLWFLMLAVLTIGASVSPWRRRPHHEDRTVIVVTNGCFLLMALNILWLPGLESEECLLGVLWIVPCVASIVYQKRKKGIRMATANFVKQEGVGSMDVQSMQQSLLDLKPHTSNFAGQPPAQQPVCRNEQHWARFCPNCGRAAGGDKFCVACGTKIPVVACV